MLYMSFEEQTRVGEYQRRWNRKFFLNMCFIFLFLDLSITAAKQKHQYHLSPRNIHRPINVMNDNRWPQNP